MEKGLFCGGKRRKRSSGVSYRFHGSTFVKSTVLLSRKRVKALQTRI